MELDKKIADKMARGSKRFNNVVFGQIDNIAEYHEFGKFKVIYKNGAELELNAVVGNFLNEIKRLSTENEKLLKMIKIIAQDLNDYKEKVGIK